MLHFPRTAPAKSDMPRGMKLLDSAWTIAALVVCVVVALAGAALGAPVEVVIITLIGAVAAVLIAAYPLSTHVEADRVHAAAPSIEEAGVLDAVPDPMLIVRQGRVVSANRAAIALLGTHILDEDVRTAIRHPAASEHLASDAVDAAGIELIGLGTRDQRWLMRIAELGDGRRLVHLADRSLAHAAERMRVDFVANASHELRTPLAAILGFIETLGDEAGEDKATRTRFLDVMMKEAQRMQGLVDDLISLSRIEAEKHRVPDDAVDLTALVAEVTRVIRQQPDSKGREFVVSVAQNVAPVAGDHAQLSQVLHNLIGNAIKYGRAGTAVQIGLERAQGGVLRLTVADEGDGIDAAHIPRLTERFYRVDSGRSRALGGTGLGLSIVKHIVERHRGRLQIASTLGKGTTVSVTLPLAAEKGIG